MTNAEIIYLPVIAYFNLYSKKFLVGHIPIRRCSRMWRSDANLYSLLQITLAAVTSPDVAAFLQDHPKKMLELFNITTDSLVIIIREQLLTAWYNPKAAHIKLTLYDSWLVRFWVTNRHMFHDFGIPSYALRLPIFKDPVAPWHYWRITWDFRFR